MYSRTTEIRHLSSADIYSLAQILEPMQFWKKLMRIIPKDLNSSSNSAGNRVELKYSADHMRLIEHATTKDGRTCTEILFDEWGCSGRKRPTVGKLLDLLIQAELFRAADHVAVNFLNETPPTRPSKGPAAKVDISIPLDPKDEKAIESALRDISYPGTVTLLENKNVASDINNQDYYEKFGQISKKLDITAHSDLMKFSSFISENIPNLSEFEIGSSSSHNVDNGFTVSDSHNVDNIQTKSTLNANVSINLKMENIPNITALNINIDEDDEETDDRVSSQASSIIPNLSIFEESKLNHQTSLVESGKDEELTFVSSGSLNNVPFLSAFRN